MVEKRKHWSKEIIKDEVLKLKENGEPLNTHHMIENHSKLYGAARSYFGSWKNLIEELGFDYDKILLKSSDHHWGKEKVLEKLISLKKEGKDLRSDHNQKVRTSLHSAAIRYYGSWGNAIEAIGLDYEKDVKEIIWDKKTIIKQLIELEEQGENLSSSDGQKNHMELFQASCRIFGSWGKAVREAGIDYSKHRKQETWDQEKVLSEMREFYKDYGTLSVSKVLEHYSKLYQASRRWFPDTGWKEIRKKALKDS